MKTIFLHDKSLIEGFLLKFPHLNFYQLGDLDDFFWPYTTWYALQDEGEIKAVNLLYTGITPPTLLAIVNDNLEDMQTLLKANLPLLPPKFYSHLSPGVEKLLEKDYHLDLHGEHYKMHLTQPENLESIETSAVENLRMEDLEEIKAFYQTSYPGNWFDPRMLETGQYVGIREKGKLMCVAGIHVYSPEYKIAALGNITTLPDRRGRGLGTTVTAGLCKLLLKTVDMIGLNVKSDNTPAIKAYEKIGFEVAAVYSEWMVELVGSR